jgi:hypothetical protein
MHPQKRVKLVQLGLYRKKIWEKKGVVEKIMATQEKQI